VDWRIDINPYTDRMRNLTLGGRENHIQKSPHVRTLSDYPVGFTLILGTDDVRVAGAATMNYLQTTMLTGAIAFFDMRSAMT